MATINIIKQSGTSTYGVAELVVDTASDISSLPVQPEFATGSSCLVIATGDVYILNSAGTWTKI